MKIFFFQDMIKDHAGTITELAEFMGIDASDEVKAKVQEQSTKAWMSSKEWRHLCVFFCLCVVVPFSRQHSWALTSLAAQV